MLRGGSGADILEGSLGDDDIDAGPGDDRVHANTGKDTVRLGSGDDDVRVRDHRRDRVDCGPGRDVVTNADRATVSGTASGFPVRLVSHAGVPQSGSAARDPRGAVCRTIR